MAIFQQEIEIVLHVDFFTDESVNSTTLYQVLRSLFPVNNQHLHEHAKIFTRHVYC